MDPLSAFGLACNVTQLISFSLEALKIFKEISSTGNTAANKAMIERSGHIQKAGEDVQAWLRQYQATSRPLTANETALQDIATRCVQTTAALQKKLKAVDKGTSGRKRAIINTGLRSLFKRSEIKELESELHDYEQTLQTRILIHLNAKQELHYLEQQERLQDIDVALVSFIQRLAEGQTQTQELIRDEADTIRQTVLRQGQDTIDHIDRGLRTQEDKRHDKEQYHRLLESLRYPEINARRNQITESHKKTFAWIYDDTLKNNWSPFSAFLQGLQKIYWIRGKAGSGKSCLMKFLTQNNRTINWKPQGSVKVFSHFFWNPGSEMQRCPKGLLLSIVYQLLQNLPDLASRLLSEQQHYSHYRNTTDWSDQELLAVFKRLAPLRDTETLCIFIDGLDEVDQEFGHRNLIQLINELASLENVKLCVSSRPEAEFRAQLEVYPHLKLEDLTQKDIETLARDELQDASFGSLERPEQQDLDILVGITVKRAEGVFLWAAYALKSLRRGLLGRDNWQNLQKRLEILPKGIENLYRTMWERLNEDEELWRGEAAWFFRFVLESMDSFLYDQHLLALTIARNPILCNRILQNQSFDFEDLKSRCIETESQLMTRCAGLLEFRRLQERDTDDQDVLYKCGIMGTVAFIHRSAHEFLCEASDGQQIMKHSRLTEEEVLRMRIMTQIALVVLTPAKERREVIHIVAALRDIQSYDEITDFGGQALKMLCLFLQVCYDVSRKGDRDCLHMMTGSKMPLNLDLSGPLHSAAPTYALDLIGFVLEKTPKLGLSFIDKYVKNRQLSTLYASHLSICTLESIIGPCRSEGDWETSDILLRLLRVLLERGADPNAICYLPWSQSYYYSWSFMGATLGKAVTSPYKISGRLFKQMSNLFTEFEWDSKQSMWLFLCGSKFSPPLLGLHRFLGTFLAVKVEMAEFLSSIDLEGNNECLVSQACHHRLWKKAFIFKNNRRLIKRPFDGATMDHLSAFEPSMEDTTLLPLAISQSRKGSIEEPSLQNRSPFSDDRASESDALWNSTVEPVLREVMSRCQEFRGEDEIAPELVRAGFLTPLADGRIEAYRSEIIRESERVLSEILATTEQETATV